ncbi:MAG: hypothetical protein Kow00105_08580 [Phycisphaeraceae bacterium]
MIGLQVEILTGPNAGRTLLLRQSLVTFGRNPDRTLPIDLPFISREHGEFVFDNHQWLLVNHSPNGTRVDGRNVTRKPRPIRGTVTIAIGDTDVFRVTPMQDETDASQQSVTPVGDDGATPGTEDKPAGTAKLASKRSKLWAGVGMFWLISFGLIAFAMLNQSGQDGTTPVDGLPPALTAEQIAADISRKPEKQTPDPRRADTALARARENYALLDRRPDALYRAYEAYREALSYTPGDSLEDPRDQRQLFILQKRLIEQVTEQYEQAMFLLKSRQYEAADKAFKELRAIYPDTKSRVFNDAIEREASAREALNKKRR